jgi:hypothetical protein
MWTAFAAWLRPYTVLIWQQDDSYGKLRSCDWNVHGVCVWCWCCFQPNYSVFGGCITPCIIDAGQQSITIEALRTEVGRMLWSRGSPLVSPCSQSVIPLALGPSGTVYKPHSIVCLGSADPTHKSRVDLRCIGSFSKIFYSCATCIGGQVTRGKIGPSCSPCYEVSLRCVA